MIAVPTFFCPKLWEDMTGDEAERFCSKCQKTVHNIASLTLDQRIALLQSPKGTVCGRYRIAVRRAAKGHEESYMRHLLKYGAGVAASSAVFITLWQLYDENHRVQVRPIFRVGSVASGTGCEMSDDYYFEETSMILGMIVATDAPKIALDGPESARAEIERVDVGLAPMELDKLLGEMEQPKIVAPSFLPTTGSTVKSARLPIKI